jgi:hypothetical protein
MLNTRGTYTVIGRMPAGGDQQPEYRIKHFSEDFQRVALKTSCRRVILNMVLMTTPALRTRCTKARN